MTDGARSTANGLHRSPGESHAGLRPTILGTPPLAETEAMMSIQTLHLMGAAKLAPAGELDRSAVEEVTDANLLRDH